MREQKRMGRVSWTYAFGLLRRGFGAILDQGFFASANFILNLVLARWLSPEEYGVFAVVYSTFLLLSTFHTALFVEPMLVYGASKYKGVFLQYVKTLLFGHFVFSILIFLVFSASSIFLRIGGQPELSSVLLGFAFGGPFILFLWFMRRVFYVTSHLQYPVMGGVLYVALIFVGALSFRNWGLLSPSSAVMILGAASLLVGLFLLVNFANKSVKDANKSVGELCRLPWLWRNVWDDHCYYGRWSVPGSIFTWVPGNLYYLLIPIWSGIEASAILRALMNLIMPLLQANAALALLFIPVFAEVRGHQFLKRSIKLSLFVMLGISVSFWIAISALRFDLMKLFYGDYYAQYADLLIPLGMLPVLTGAIAVVGGVLRAKREPEKVFWAYFYASLASALLGVMFLGKFGVHGGVAGLLIAYALVLVIMIRNLLLQDRKM